MGVHGGGTSVAPSQMRTPTQLEAQVMERAGMDTNCHRPLASRLLGAAVDCKGVVELYA